MRLSIVAIGMAWLAVVAVRIVTAGASGRLIEQALAAVVLLIAPWQAFKGGDG